MFKHLLPFAVLALAPLAFGQLESNSITVTATRATTLQPDQVVFAIFVDTPTSATLTDVLAALSGSGLTVSNFAGVGATTSGFTIGGPSTLITPQLEWAFGLPVPLAKMKDTTASLTTLQQSVEKNNPGFRVTFNVQGLTVSQQAQQAVSCSIPDLLADARAQAQKLAAASGVNLGQVLALSSSANMSVPSSSAVAGLSIGRYYTTSPTGSLPFCGLTVKFAIVRF